MDKSLEIKNLATALSKFQGAMDGIAKDSSNPFFKSKYASLSVAIAETRDLLSKNGLSYAQFPTGEGGLTTILMHTSGEWISDTFVMKPTDNKPQTYGSMITYMRRYSLFSILGLQVEDDDGNEASGNRAQKMYKNYPSKKTPSDDENATGAVIYVEDSPEEYGDATPTVTGTDTDEPQVEIPETKIKQRQKIYTLLRLQGVDIGSKKACTQYVADMTQLALTEGNFPEIIRILSKL